MKHIFVSHPIDEQHYYFSMFTSQENVFINKENIKNFMCESEYFKYINTPFIANQLHFDNFIDVSFDKKDILKILGVKQQNSILQSIIGDMVYNFKRSFSLSPNENIVKILSIESAAFNKLKINVKTRQNIFYADIRENIYTNKTIDMVFKKEINIHTFYNKNISLFEISQEAITEGVVELFNNLH